MKGRRLQNTPIGDLPDGFRGGDYWKVLTRDGGGPVHLDEPSNLTGAMWMVVAPGDDAPATLSKHTVREEEDGTISVRPNDGSSNSILISPGGWHGYIEHGVWASV